MRVNSFIGVFNRVGKKIGVSFLCLLFCLMPTDGYTGATRKAKKSNVRYTKIKKSRAGSRARKQKYIITIDAGHGGSDTGAEVKECSEKMLCLMTALMVKKKLNDRGYKVVLTRVNDTYVSLHQRASIATKSKSDLFVSIHFNSAPSSKASGIEVFVPRTSKASRKKECKALAASVIASTKKQSGSSSRGIKEANFMVLKETKMPAILFEGGFITSSEERKKLLNPKYLEKLASGISEGIDLYIKKSKK